MPTLSYALLSIIRPPLTDPPGLLLTLVIEEGIGEKCIINLSVARTTAWI